MRSLQTLLLLLLTSATFAQIGLFDENGISLQYKTSVTKSVYCDKYKKTVYFIKVRWTLSNTSGKNARINYGVTMPFTDVVYCTPNGVYDEVFSTTYQPSGGASPVILKTGDKAFGENARWYFSNDITPGFNLSYEFPTSGTTLKIDVDLTPTNSNKRPEKPAYGIYQKDNIVNPKPQVDYAQKQKEENKTTDNNIKAWQNSYQDNQNQINKINAIPNKYQLQQTPQQQELQRQQQINAQQKLNEIQQNFAEQQQRYQQTQIELDNAKNVSMNAYQEAINSGRKESGALLESALSGGAQISDPKGSLIYTGVGLGVSLFVHLAEKKAEKKEKESAAIKEKERLSKEKIKEEQRLREEERIREEERVKEIEREKERKQLIIDTKGVFIKEALDINKYSFSDLASRPRFAAILIYPQRFDAEDQTIYFSIPVQVLKYKDNTYPLKEDVQKKILAAVDKAILQNNTVYVLFPIINYEKFQNDFIKKMGSGTVVSLNAELINFTKDPFLENKNTNKTDFWGEELKTPANKQIKKQPEKKFWDQ